MIRFLWVFFQIEDICSLTTDEEIREMVHSLPRDLLETYARALLKIVTNRKTDLASKIFRWVAATKRPLSVLELREAIAVEPCQPFSEVDKFVNKIEHMIPWCANLLVLDEEEHLVQFAHHSIKDYLLSTPKNPLLEPFHFALAEADHLAGEICCTYHQFNDFKRQLIKQPNTKTTLDPQYIVRASFSSARSNVVAKSWLKLERLWRSSRVTKNAGAWRHLQFLSLGDTNSLLHKLQDQYSFLAYASEHWLSHTSTFRQETSKTWTLWKNLVLGENSLAPKPWISQDWETFAWSVQRYIIEHDHSTLVELWIDEYSGRRFPRELLLEVAYSGSTALYRRLLELQHCDERTWKSLFTDASYNGQEAIVELLLELGQSSKTDQPYLALSISPADRITFAMSALPEVDGCLGLYDRLLTMTASQATPRRTKDTLEMKIALCYGNLKAVKRLLAANVDPDVLLESSTDSYRVVEAEDGLPPISRLKSMTALHVAVVDGNFEILNALLDAGANVNLLAPDGHTALSLAAKKGNVDIMYQLLLAGADTRDTDRIINDLAATDPALRIAFKDAKMLAYSHR